MLKQLLRREPQEHFQHHTLRAVLIFPPGWTAYAPYLALPALAAVARRAGFAVDLLDLNVEYYDHVLTHSFLAGQIEACRRELGTATSWRRKRTLTGALAYADIANSIEDTKSLLRERGRQVSVADVRFLIDTLTRALYVAAAPVPGYRLLLNRFELPIDIESISDTAAGLCDRARNPFIDFFESEALPRIIAGGYRFVGISITSETQLVPGLTLLRLIRRTLDSDVHVCVGGNFITRLMRLRAAPPPELLGEASSIVTDEGEHAFVSLLEHLSNGTTLQSIPGVVLPSATNSDLTPSVQLDISELPTPDFSGLPLDKYFSPELILPVYSSRSCFAKCTFCAIPAASSINSVLAGCDLRYSESP